MFKQGLCQCGPTGGFGGVTVHASSLSCAFCLRRIWSVFNGLRPPEGLPQAVSGGCCLVRHGVGTVGGG